MTLNVITYNRAEMLAENLAYYPEGVQLIVFDGGMNLENQIKTHKVILGHQMVWYDKAFGDGLTQVWNTFISVLEHHVYEVPYHQYADGICIIEDDCRPHPEFMQRLNRYRESLRLKHSFVPVTGTGIKERFLLNLLTIPGRDAYYYTGVKSKEYDAELMQCGWIDGNYWIPAHLVRPIYEHFKKFKKRPPYKKSSGVGIELSRFCVKNNIRIFMPKETMLAHGDHESILFPEGRRKHPLIAKFEP